MKDVITNFWVNFDMLQCTAGNWYAKSYIIDGSLEQKIEHLKALSQSDYQTVNDVSFHPTFLHQQTHLKDFRTLFKQHQYYFFKQAANNLFNFDHVDINNGKEKVTNSVYLITYMFESPFNDIALPYTTASNIDWINQEASKCIGDSFSKIQSFNPIQELVIR